MSIKTSIARAIVAAIAQSFLAGAGGAAYPANLEFYALDTQGGEYVNSVIVGNGGITEASTTTRFYPDNSSVWQAFGPGVVGRVYHDNDWWYPYHCGWTNSITYSSNLTDASWSKTNVTPTFDQIGMRGEANGASLLTATANGGTAIHSGVTATSADHSSRWFIQRDLGVGTVEITMDNGATWTDITGELTSGKRTGWYEAAIAQTLANPQIGIRLGTSGDSVIVGNAELAIAPAVGNSAIGILRMNSAIFTNGATGSVDETIPTVAGTNHNNLRGLYYFECFLPSADADYGLTDMYIPSLSATAADATPCNFANGQVWSSQYLQPAAGGATTQVTRSVVANTRFRVASWYSTTEATANFSLDGDIASGASPFSGFSSDGSMYLIRRQTGGNLSGVILIRNIRRYAIPDMAAGRSLSLDLIHGTTAWGQNLMVLSNRPDLYTQNNNAWTVTGATVLRDAVGYGGEPNTACTVTDPDTGLRILRQNSIPIVADTRPYTFRFLIKKIEVAPSGFFEFNCGLIGGTVQNFFFGLNEQTGAIAHRAGSPIFTAQEYPLDPALWEVVGTIVNNGTNNLGNLNIYPKYSATNGGASSAALTGSFVLDNCELYAGVESAAVLGQEPAYTPQMRAPEVQPI